MAKKDPPAEATEETPEESGEEMSAEERDKRLQKAYTAATQELRDTYRNQFNKLYSKHAELNGVEWSPRPSAEEKAEKEFDKLIAEFPHLRDRLDQSEPEEEERPEDEGSDEPTPEQLPA